MSNMSMETIKGIRKQQKTEMVSFRELPALSKTNIEHAKLPALYTKARTALQACCRVDEVKEVKNQHEAIAVYAKQIKDTTLLYYAERIKLRAIERIGELLSEIPEGKERDKAATEGGVAIATSRHAVRITQIPPRVRTTLIEQTPPPSYMNMSRQAMQGYAGPMYREFHRHTAAERAVTFSAVHRAEQIYEAVDELRRNLDSFMTDMQDGRYTPKHIALAVRDNVEILGFSTIDMSRVIAKLMRQLSELWNAIPHPRVGAEDE